MELKRRQLFQIIGAGSALSTLGVGTAFAAQPKFVEPTAEKPLLLCFNENPLGMSDKAKEAVAKASLYGSRYPFAQVIAFKKELAKFSNVTPDEILLTHGSAEAIRAAIEAYVTKNTVLVQPELTYGDGADVAKRNNIPVKSVKMGPNWSIDLAALRKLAASEAKKHHVIVYLVNPNNPTSTITDTEGVFNWIKSQPKNTFFIIDEAYAEFVNDPSFRSCTELVRQGFDNLVILKTFSKIFAMAGMRLGFAVGAAKVINRIRDHVAYEVMMNQTTLAAALAELNDKEFLKESKESNDEAREILYKALNELKIPYLPSQTNFVFIDLKAPLKPFADHMKAEHILVGRPFPPAVQWCRISLGTPAEMRYFVEKLKEFRNKGWV